MNRLVMASMLAAALGVAIGCQEPGGLGSVSTGQGTLVKLSVPNMT
jgi:hypothetical protein